MTTTTAKKPRRSAAVVYRPRFSEDFGTGQDHEIHQAIRDRYFADPDQYDFEDTVVTARPKGPRH